MITAPEPALYWVLSALFGALMVGSLARFVGLRHSSEETRQKRLASLRTWWMLAIGISIAMLAGRPGISLLLGIASCVAWYEITHLYGPRNEDRVAIGAGYLLIATNYCLLLFGAASLYVAFLPVFAPVVLAILLLLKDYPTGYIRSGGGLLWGIMFLGYGVSHAAFLMLLPQTNSGPLGPAGWVLFLIILTETDDIFQALIGRLFGAHKRHRIAPVVSPNKTWEGFIGGLLVIVVLAPLIAPWLTSLGQVEGALPLPLSLQPVIVPVLAALLISCAGFFGDINMSAIKRDCGVKDSSKLLPGMGGVIDRVDSLSMTAPVFAYFVIWWQG